MFSVSFGDIVDISSYKLNKKQKIESKPNIKHNKLERAPESDAFIPSIYSASNPLHSDNKEKTIKDFANYFAKQNALMQKEHKSPYKVANEIKPVLQDKNLMNAMINAYEDKDIENLDKFYRAFHNLSRRLNDSLDESKRTEMNKLLSLYYDDSEHLMYQGITDEEKSNIVSLFPAKEN